MISSSSIAYVFSAVKPTNFAPEFTQPLKSAKVSQGSQVKLTCELLASPEPIIEWFKDGNRLQASKRIKMAFDGQSASVSLMEAKLEDEGDYKCVARNESGSASSTAELLIKKEATKPIFKETMKDVEVSEEEEGRFDVRVSGRPVPMVEWFKGSTKIEDAGKFILIDDEVEEDLFSLIIETVTPDDVGSYTCKASNEAGQITCKAGLALQERVMAPEFAGDVDSGPVTALEGDEVALNVTIKGKPRPDVEWYKNDKRITKTSRYNVKERGDKFSLVIMNVNPDDSGVYKCVASSKVGRVNRTFQVNIDSKS